MARFGWFFRDLPWADLEPDLDASVATAGLGEARGLDRVTAAIARDRRSVVAYLPVCRPLTIDSRQLAGPRLSVAWFEPATGRRAVEPARAVGGPIVLAPPFAEDSVLSLASTG
jgi:hypothetical protein